MLGFHAWLKSGVRACWQKQQAVVQQLLIRLVLASVGCVWVVVQLEQHLAWQLHLHRAHLPCPRVELEQQAG